MTPQELWDAALTLENDGDFYKKYTNSPPSLSKDRRERISPGMLRCKLPACFPEDREQLRRYLDDVWQLPSATHGLDDISQRCAALDTIEFWKDEVRFPTKEVSTTPYQPPGWYKGPTVGTKYTPSLNSRKTDNDYPRCGKLWEPEEYEELTRRFCAGEPLSSICELMRRPPGGAKTKLAQLGFLKYNVLSGEYIVLAPPPFRAPVGANYLDRLPQPSEQTIAAINSFDSKETIMTASIIEITTKTLINGIDIATMSNSQLYSTIASQEEEIKKLEKIENKPKRLVNEIDKRKAGIRALVSFLDAKEAPTT